MKHQPGVTQELTSNALFLTWEVQIHTQAPDVIRNCIEFSKQLSKKHPDAQLTTVVGIGLNLWTQLSSQKPKEMKNFETLDTPIEKIVSTQGDVFFHIKSMRTDFCFEVAQFIQNAFAPFAQVKDETHGFQYLDSRDLTGFIDGTANPKGETERQEAALIGKEDPDFIRGSYMIAQRFVHRLSEWSQLSVEEQENAIGRTKEDSIALEGDRKLPHSHITRAETHVNGEELKIVRQSLPYGNATGEKGLFFIAYSKSRITFDLMLRRLYGLEKDGIHDRLMEFTSPVLSGYYFAPSEELLNQL